MTSSCARRAGRTTTSTHPAGPALGRVPRGRDRRSRRAARREPADHPARPGRAGGGGPAHAASTAAPSPTEGPRRPALRRGRRGARGREGRDSRPRRRARRGRRRPCCSTSAPPPTGWPGSCTAAALTVITSNLVVFEELARRRGHRAGAARRHGPARLPLPGRLPHRGQPAPAARRLALPRHQRRAARTARCMDTTVVEVPVKRAMIEAGRPGRPARRRGEVPRHGHGKVCGPEDLDVRGHERADADPATRSTRGGRARRRHGRKGATHEADDSGRRRIPGAAGVRGAARRPRRGPGHRGGPARPGRRPARGDRRGSSPSRRQGVPDAPEVHATTDLDEALRGADFVFSAIRVGGLEGRADDERVALARACSARRRSAPAASPTACARSRSPCDIAERVAALAPDAWVINFTNPAGLVTEAMSRHLGDRVIGICDSPVGLGRRVARRARRRPGRGVARLRRPQPPRLAARPARRRPRRLPRLLADDPALGSFEEGKLFGADWLQSLGAHPQRVPALLLLQPRGRRPHSAAGRPAAPSSSTSRAVLRRR